MSRYKILKDDSGVVITARDEENHWYPVVFGRSQFRIIALLKAVVKLFIHLYL